VAVGLVLPQLQGKLDGMAIRVPTPNVSLVDLVVQVEKSTTKEEVNSILKSASEGEMKGILGYSDEPLVSIDYNGCPLSSTVDGLSTKVLGNQIKVVSWYDNESGYSHRVKDLAVMVGEA
jgi:glyceraldehyde 3-phosphate dehydrogenase